MAPNIDINTLRREVDEVRDSYPTWTLDNAFVHWFLQAFLVSDSELAARSVTGVSHDKGVDGVYIDESFAKVFVLQGKFHQGPKPLAESRSEVIAFSQLARKLVGTEIDFRNYCAGIDPSVGQLLLQARTRIKKRQYELSLYYVTTGKCSSPLKSEAESEVAQAAGRASISILDRTDILSLLIDYLGGAAPPVPFLDLRIDSHQSSGSEGIIQRFDAETGIESWVLSMSGQDVGDLYARAGDRLYARNIRGFLGDTAINDGMRQTLKSTPEYFWYFNNGVTIVCDSARKTSERGRAILRVTNPQVINGQQSTRTLHVASTKGAAVLVRVISVLRDHDQGQKRFERLVSNIVAATNFQNAILASDLRSNDTRQVVLQREFAKLKYRYLRKRQTKKEAKRLFGIQHGYWIKKEELAQIVAACELDPVTVRSGKEGLFKPPHYDKIFDGRALRVYLSMYWMARIVKNRGAGYPNRAYAKWHVMHFLWHRVGSLLQRKSAADIFRVWGEKGKWPGSLEKATDAVYIAIIDFFRQHRGKGPHEVDISNFFYRPHQHNAFEVFWRKSRNRHRTFFTNLINDFDEELHKALTEHN